MKNTLKATITVGAMALTAGTLAGWTSSNAKPEASTAVVSESSMRTTTYTVDPTHASVVFKIRHRGVANFYGRFNDVQGAVEFDKVRPERSSMSFTVLTKSVDTSNRTRDGHLRGADFFNSRQFPEATFTSTSIEESGDGVYTLKGDFTLQGKTIELEAEMSDVSSRKVDGSDLMGFEVRFSLKRSEFGITKHLDSSDPENGPLGDLVELTFAFEAVAQ